MEFSKAQFDVLRENILKTILQFVNRNKKIMATSSFQTQSVPLLHILSKSPVPIPIYFLNTGFHFPETIEFKNRIAELFKLNIVDVYPSVSKFQQKDARGQLLYMSDPDRCCYYNKVQPMELLKKNYDVWISGIRKDQSKIRKTFKQIEIVKDNILRYHPMLDWSAEAIEAYIEIFKLPRHPLAQSVFSVSIGCEPCTILSFSSQSDISDNSVRSEIGRNTRWPGLKKTECGLHLNPPQNS